MKRFVILSLCMILSVILFGCDNAKNEIYWSFNTDKAEETALEYMNEKYDKNFYIVSSEKTMMLAIFLQQFKNSGAM